jgi:hypothetical protein
MNAFNSAMNSLFDVLLTPLEAVGQGFAVYTLSGVFGVLALVIFKRISWQAGITATKGKIKGHMIEIRIYQNDLVLVSKAIAKVLLRNAQYLALNFGPFIPLSIPFVIVAAQMVTRYGFDPMPIHEPGLAGQGIELVIEMTEDQKGSAADVQIELPEGVRAASPIVRSPGQGRVFVELLPWQDGRYEIQIIVGDQVITKLLHVGDEYRGRQMQGERVRSLLDVMLWPAEDSLSGTSFQRVALQTYPESSPPWFPMGGPLGVLLAFVLGSMVTGLIAIKPLGVQI